MMQQTDFNLQPYTKSDAGAVVQVVNAAAARTIGVQRAVVDSFGGVRLSHYVSPTSEKVVVTNAHNKVVVMPIWWIQSNTLSMKSVAQFIPVIKVNFDAPVMVFSEEPIINN